jgi:hypothetical protein
VAAVLATDASTPPAWTQQTVAGLVYAAELTGAAGIPALRAPLIAARAEWCRDNGCHRRPKTCIEVFGNRPEPCRPAATETRAGRPPGVAPLFPGLAAKHAAHARD